MSRYFKIGKRRMIGMIIGNILLGLGVSLFKFSGMGNDPFSAMVMSLSAQLGLSYSTFLVILNLFIFIVEITLGRKYIGLGTFLCALGLGPVIHFFNHRISQKVIYPSSGVTVLHQ